MAEVVIKKREEIEVLKIVVGEEAYSLPLGGSIPYRKLKKLTSEEGIFDFLAEHIPEKVLDELTSKDVTAIFQAWSQATKEANGATPGES